VPHGPTTGAGQLVAAPLSGEVIQSLVDDAARTLGDWEASAKSAGLPNMRSQMVNGVAWNEIVRLLEDDRAYDLVVMGTHGRTGLKHVLVGSVAERAVRRAPCSSCSSCGDPSSRPTSLSLLLA